MLQKLSHSMLVNPSEPFWSKVLKIRGGNVHVEYMGRRYKVHTCPEQTFRIGDQIECFAERFSDTDILLHQTRRFLYESLYAINDSYDFGVVCDKMDYSINQRYLELIDEQNVLFHKLYIGSLVDDKKFLSYIRGAYLRCRIDDVSERGFVLKLQNISAFKYVKVVETEYSTYDMWECDLSEYLQRYQVLLGGAATGEIWIIGKNNEDLGVLQLEDNCESVVLECNQDEDTGSDEIIVGDTDPEIQSARTINLEQPKSIGKKKFIARYSDYSERQEQNSKVGHRGEKFVVRHEVDRLVKAGREDLADRVEWVSKTQGDGLGYDVLSFDAETGKPVFIEVKTTNGSCNSAFYITRNELERSRVSDNYYLYRLCDYDCETDSYQILIISGDLSTLCNEPATYYVRIEE